METYVKTTQAGVLAWNNIVALQHLYCKYLNCVAFSSHWVNRSKVLLLQQRKLKVLCTAMQQ